MGSSGKGFAKTILFGEHFVVYGLPGIAAGLDKFVQADVQTLKDSKEIIFDDKVFGEKFSISEQPEHIKSQLFNAMFSKEDLNEKGLKINITANFPHGAGLGYSAALSVAIARAVSTELDLDLKDEEINDLAFKAEKIAHGDPSGIDNTCATYGTTILFEKDFKTNENKLKQLKNSAKLFCLLVDTGIKHNTKEAIKKVKENKEANPQEFERIFSDYKKIIVKAKQELKFGGIKELGKLMNENQELLKRIGVSCKEAEDIIRTATFENCLGAKVTGAGCGGNVLILCGIEKELDKIANILQAKKYSIIKTKIS